MKIVRISQQNDREHWLEFRRAKITGTTSKGIRPLSRGTDRTPQGFWNLLAQKIAVEIDGETPLERGQRCENEALQWLTDTLGIELDLDPGVWVSEHNENVILSPDASEPGENPTYAAEAKNLNTANHLKYIYKDMNARKSGDYNPFYSIPSDSKSDYQDQVLNYFVVNENLQKIYFVLADDRVIYPELERYVIVVHRADVQHLVDELREIQLTAIKRVDEVINELLKEIKRDG